MEKKLKIQDERENIIEGVNEIIEKMVGFIDYGYVI